MLKREEKKEMSTDLKIVQNRVVEARISDKDIESGGKLSEGYVEDLGRVRILDKDYGKSAELMRYILEEGRVGGSRRIIVFLGVFLILCFTLLIIILISRDNGGEEVKENRGDLLYSESLPSNNTPIQTQTGSIDIIDNNYESQKSELESERKELEALKLSIEAEKQNIERMQEYSNISVRTEYLNRDIQECRQDLNEYRVSENEYRQQYNQSQNELRNCEAQLKNKDEYGRDSFIYNLGKQVFEKCEENRTEACEELYYNYVRYDTTER